MSRLRLETGTSLMTRVRKDANSGAEMGRVAGVGVGVGVGVQVGQRRQVVVRQRRLGLPVMLGAMG